MKNFIFLAISALLIKPVADKESFMLVGTYTAGKSTGIYVYKFNSTTGEATLADSVKIGNPSYLAISPSQKYVYAVEEEADQKGKGGKIAAFSFDKTTGRLTRLNEQSTGGDHPCYVSVDKTGKWVAAANYSSGSAVIFPVNKDGSLAPAKQVIQHEGSSVNADRQKGPHVHSTVFSPDNKFLFVQDLGIDKIMVYAFNSKTGELKPASFGHTDVEAGHGPRHLDFHPSGKYAYLIEEMSGSISAYKYLKNGDLELVQNISALRGDFNGKIGSADIHVSPDGKFLYASNRGDLNDIAIFSINRQNGLLQRQGEQPTMGKTPRNFNLDPSGNFLLVANQNSDNIVVFKRDLASGLLTETSRIDVGNPVCIKWIQ
jgi:6-phosphogluconolactonase